MRALMSGFESDVRQSDDQPYAYHRRVIHEPDWRRLPGYARVSEADWCSASWQRTNSVTTVRGLAAVFGEHLPSELGRSIEADTQTLATMPLRATPHVLNTMNEQDLWHDPIRHYVLPAACDREPVWHTHPEARRDSLHETEMSVEEGMVWRYPTKALIELATTCPVYCGHCTRMDLVGTDLPGLKKRRLQGHLGERLDRILAYLTKTPSIRDLVISGGDLANVRLDVLESFVEKALESGHIRTFRLATKGLIVLPQHFLQDEVRRAMERISKLARRAGAEMSVHTHANHAQSVTPLVARAAAALREAGVDAIRNQGVLLRGVNATASSVLDLCFTLLDGAQITPYYFYLCDMIPNAEHWRTTLDTALEIQDRIMGYLSGFATPRLVCDVPYVGKRWVHQVKAYDRVRGVSQWSKNYRTSIEHKEGDPMAEVYPYFDPIAQLPPEGQAYWVQRLVRPAEDAIERELPLSPRLSL